MASTYIYTLSLHDALPIFRQRANRSRADSKGPFGRRAPFAKPCILPNSRVNSVTTLLVSLNSTTLRTRAVAFSEDILSNHIHVQRRIADGIRQRVDCIIAMY